MSFQYDISRQEPAISEEDESQFWAEQLARYLRPYQERLEVYVDRRVVGNLMATVGAIVQSRCALTTSELGSAICGPAHGEAGTQRLQYALHHQGWEAEVIEEVLWQEAEQRRKLMQQRGETPLCIWDSSVVEKPESEKLQGLGTVRSSKVRRLARSRKGLYNQPSRIPVSVRGYEWESLLLVGASGIPQVLALPVRHPEYQGQLWLVVVRQGRGREPWYLLTNEPVETIAQAWEMVFSYVSRWKIEESFRFQKCELLIDSLRLRSWQAQRKLLLLVTLAYGALLAMLSPPLWRGRCPLMVYWCQRADWRLWRGSTPPPPPRCALRPRRRCPPPPPRGPG